MSDLPSMPLFVDDFEAATAHLTLEEDGAYNRLLRLCWRTPGGSVPDDRSWIMRRMRVDEATYDRVVAPIIDEFFTRKNGRISQRRLLAELDYVKRVSEARKEAGKRGGQSKARKTKEKASSKSKNLPKQNGSKAVAPTPTPTPTPKEPPISPNGGQSDLLGEPDPKPRDPTPVDILAEIIPKDLARDFVDHRKALKKPMSVVAARRALEQLRTFDDPSASVSASIINGWSGVFPRDAPRGPATQATGSGLMRRVQERYGS